MKHLSSWEKIALVSDHELINTFAKFFDYILSSEIRLFKNSELEEAKYGSVKNEKENSDV